MFNEDSCAVGSRAVQADRSLAQNRAGYQPVNYGGNHRNESYGNGFSGFGDDPGLDEGKLFLSGVLISMRCFTSFMHEIEAVCQWMILEETGVFLIGNLSIQTWFQVFVMFTCSQMMMVCLQEHSP